MELEIRFTEKNTSAFDLGWMTWVDEGGEVVFDTGLSMPWIDLSLLIWCLERLASREGAVTFCSSASSFEMTMSIIGEQLEFHGVVCPFDKFAEIVLASATKLLVSSKHVSEADVARLDLVNALQRLKEALDRDDLFHGV